MLPVSNDVADAGEGGRSVRDLAGGYVGVGGRVSGDINVGVRRVFMGAKRGLCCMVCLVVVHGCEGKRMNFGYF